MVVEIPLEDGIGIGLFVALAVCIIKALHYYLLLLPDGIERKGGR